jgi:3-oxoacyl-[acyl-carrier protein] reductase
MPGRLDGMVVIVTGSSRSIGHAVAVEMGREGARVAVCGRTSDDAQGDGAIEGTAREITDLGGEAIAIRCDVAVEDDVNTLVAEVVARWGHIDVLVNNAATLWRHGVLETTTDLWRQLLRTNLDGVFYCSKAVLPTMIAQQSGTIINLTSGRSRADDGKTTAYTVAKAGVERLTLNLATEVREHGIAINAIDPGPVLTRGVMDNIPESRYQEFMPIEDERVKIVPACIQLAAEAGLKESFMTGRILLASDYLNWSD